MTPRSKRPIVPELRDIPLTFLNCNDRKEFPFQCNTHECHHGIKYPEVPAWTCEYRREIGKCPRGFAA